MKLILKRITPGPTYVSLDELHISPREKPLAQPFALHTEDGQILPCQVNTCMFSEAGDVARLTVTFTVDGKNVMVQGDAFGSKS